MKRYGFSILLALLPQISFGQTLTSSALYARCYAHFTGRPVPLKSETMVSVRQGKISPVDACMQLLEKSSLNSEGRLSINDEESRAVLRQFQDVHRSWLGAARVEDIQDHGDEIGNGTEDVFDTTEAALGITYQLFSPSGRYEKVLTADRGYVALREMDAVKSQRVGLDPSVTNPSRRLYGGSDFMLGNSFIFHRAGTPGFTDSGDRSETISLPMIRVGELVGIVPQFQSASGNNFAVAPLNYDTFADQVPGLQPKPDLFRSFGGGVLGLPVTLMMTSGHPKGTFFNGAQKVPRRWMESNMKTFLCANFPMLRESDILKFVVPTSSVPFRQQRSCVSCHATLDRGAYAARNIAVGSSDFTRPFGGRSRLTELVSSFDQAAGNPGLSNSWPSEPVGDFHRTNPDAVLFFRSHTGALIEKSVQGIAGLGQALSETDDFYQCAAKRYFEYFTGIRVALYDRGDARYAETNRLLSPESAVDRKFIELLGADLKQSQSLRQLIRAIISSDYYKQQNFRVRKGAS